MVETGGASDDDAELTRLKEKYRRHKDRAMAMKKEMLLHAKGELKRREASVYASAEEERNPIEDALRQSLLLRHHCGDKAADRFMIAVLSHGDEGDVDAPFQAAPSSDSLGARPESRRFSRLSVDLIRRKSVVGREQALFVRRNTDAHGKAAPACAKDPVDRDISVSRHAAILVAELLLYHR
eukprot:gene20207-31069_t